jgi:nucleotide-binding universal stress UspA family protein
MFDTIVTATDGSDNASRAVKLAAGLAAAHDATLVVLHVVGEGEVPEPLRRMAEVEHLVKPEHLGGSQVANVSAGLSLAQRAETAAHLARVHDAVADRLLSDARGVCEAAGAKRIEVAKAAGDPARAIVGVAEARGADLVVLGTRGMSDLKGLLLGSVSHKVMQLTTCPCMVVR